MILIQPEAPPEAPVIEAPEPDPLPIEEVVQAQAQNLEPVKEAIVDQGEVLAMDDVTNSDDEFLQPPAPVPQPDVQVNIPVLQNPKAWIVDEVPLEDLVPFDDLVPQPLPHVDQDMNNIQLGFVETFTSLVDLTQFLASSSKGPSAAAVRCWAKHFSPIDRSRPTVSMPTKCMDFFSLLLLKPGFFEWAKDFLTSPTWAALSKMFNGNSCSFSLPKSSPTVIISDYSCSEPPKPFCIDIEDAETDGSEKVSAEDPASADKENRLAGKQPMNTTLVEQETMTPPPSIIPTVLALRAKHGKAPIFSDALLRRSERVHNNTKGFKSPSCKHRDCLGCSSDPPPFLLL